MAEETIISFNATNWVTVVIMVTLTFLLFATIVGFVRRKNGGNNG